jgi:putative peptide zinc metalloprotease protein
MSTTAGTTGGPIGAPLGRRPARAAGLELLGEVGGSGYRQPPSLVRRADGQMVQVTPLLFQLLDAIDGERDDDALAAALGERCGKHVTAEDVRFLIDKRLRPLGVLRQPDGSEPAVKKMNPLLALRLKLVVSSPAATRLISAPFVQFFRPAVIAPLVVAFLLTIWWVAFHQGLAPAARQALYQPELLLVVFALTWLSAGFHELGHAAACRYGGARPGAMGVGLYLVWPAFYTDVTDSYRLSRRGRLRVDLGGLYFNMIFGVGIFVAWTLLHTDALLLVIAAQLLQMIRQLVPFVRFDGYHILADLTGVPDLFLHIKPTLLGLVRRKSAGALPLKRWVRVLVTVWVLAVIPLLAVIFGGMVYLMPRIFATAWDSLGIRAGELTAGWDEADVADVAYTGLRMLMICLPVAGMVYMVTRIGRRAVRSTWRGTAGRPLLRAGAAALALAMLGGVAWAWRPGDQYRPIQANELWRLGVFPQLPVQRIPEAEPASSSLRVTPPAPPATPTASGPAPARRPTRAAGHYEWRPVLVGQPKRPPASSANSSTSSVTVIVPTEQLPPRAMPAPQPAAAVPADAPAAAGTVRPAWPFPWPQPRTPVDGDNQVLSVNTHDGSTEYHVAMALLWVSDGDDVTERNEAYAYASCNDCRTGAVAFQVILIVGYSGTITPVNSAVSANYDCQRCSTQAVAVQLVATVSSEPDAATKAKLEQIMAELQAKSATFQSLPAEQVYATLLAAEQQMLEVLGSADGASVEHASTDTATETTPTTTSPTNTTTTTETTPPTETAPTETTPTPDTATTADEPVGAEPAETTTTETTTTETTTTETTTTETTTTETTTTETTPTEPPPGDGTGG